MGCKYKLLGKKQNGHIFLFTGNYHRHVTAEKVGQVQSERIRGYKKNIGTSTIGTPRG
jgi:hypothetical protein